MRVVSGRMRVQVSVSMHMRMLLTAREDACHVLHVSRIRNEAPAAATATASPP